MMKVWKQLSMKLKAVTYDHFLDEKIEESSSSSEEIEQSQVQPEQKKCIVLLERSKGS